MSNVDIHPSDQKIIVDSTERIVVRDKVVDVVNTHTGLRIIPTGPPGPPGPTPVVLSPAAQGVQEFPSMTWIMDHDLGYMPAAFRFFDETGQEWEPEEVTYINENRTVAQWPEPMMGLWYVS